MLWGLTHSLNGPAWSLTQEYLANVVYGLWGNRAKNWVLFLIVLTAALLLLKVSVDHNTLVLGAAWADIWVAPIRLATSFTLGLLLSRLKIRWKLASAFPVLSLCLIGMMLLPTFSRWNGLIEWWMALAVSPAIVIAGAGQTAVDGRWGPVCRLSGRLSYPLYMLHYPFVLYFLHWYSSRTPTMGQMWLGILVTLACGILFSFTVMRWVDEPLRALLSRRLRSRTSATDVLQNRAA